MTQMKTHRSQPDPNELITDDIGFYAIIPAFVRRNKNLEYGAMILYGELTALTMQQGYCWASNAYLASLFEVDERTIQYWLKALKDEGLIEVELYKVGMIQKRKIWIDSGYQKMFTERKKCQARNEKDVRQGAQEMSPIINTSNKNTSIKRSKGDDESGRDFDSSISTLACASGDSIAAPPPLAKEVVDTPSQWDLKNPSAETKAVIDTEAKWKPHFKPKTVKGWLQKYGGAETYYIILAMLELMQNAKKPIENPEAYAEKLLKEKFYIKNKNALRNKDYAKQFRDFYKWSGLKMNKKYCVVLDTNQDFSYDLPPETFDAGLKHAYNKFRSTRGE